MRTPKRTNTPAIAATERRERFSADRLQRKSETDSRPRGASSPWRLLGWLPHRSHPADFRLFCARNFRGGGGHQKSAALGPVTAWVSRADFFSWSQTFEYASRNQTFQTHATARSRRQSQRLQGLGDAPACGWQGNNRNCSIYFRDQDRPPRGVVKCLGSSDRGPVGPQRTFFREIPENFFSRGSFAFAGHHTRVCPRTLLGSRAKKLPRNSGWGGWVGAAMR